MKVDESNISHDFDALLDRYGGVINKVCYFYAVDTDDFRDLRQEALLNIWRGLERFKGESGMSTWIYRVTLNSCVSYFRRNKRSRKAEPIENHPEIIADSEDRAAMVRELYALINRLDSVDKAVILLWLDDNDYQTIADIVGMGKSAVGVRIHRIKEKLVELSNK